MKPQIGNTSRLDVRVLSEMPEIEAIGPAWQALERYGHDPGNPFAAFDWSYQWLRHFSGENLSPQIIAVFDGGELISVWPMELVRKGQIASLRWLSTGALQYGGPLIARSHSPAAVFEAVWPVLCDAPADLVQLQMIRTDNAVHALLADKCLSAGKVPSFQVTLSRYDSYAGWQAVHKKTARRARNKRYNKLARSGALSFKVHRPGEVFNQLVSTALTWKRDWLDARNLPGGMVANPAFEKFLSACAGPGEEPRNGTWVISELSLDGHPLAIGIGAIRGGCYFSYLGAFDPEFAHYSPGKVEISQTIKWCIENGIGCYDLLCNHSTYKEDWCDKESIVENFSLALTAKGRAYHSVWLKRLKPFVRETVKRLPTRHRGILLSALHKLKGGETGKAHSG